MADQTSQSSTSPLTPSTAQLTMRKAAFLAANRHLATQPQTVSRVAGRLNEKKRQDDKEVFGSILSNLEKGGGLPEAEVVNQPLPTEEVTAEVKEEETRRSALVIVDPKETANAESNEEPFRVALEEMVVEKQPEVAEEKKKKKKSKEKKVGEGEPSHHRKVEKKTKEKEDEKDEEGRLRKRKERSERKERR
ncbi:protein PXR1-like [Benincasa hispida]|uniref:protein PXR1-like n=1 Tax=Benincasa hispida TaxID=102211 RepID=UPI001902A5CB|nr:protein PXR1-like [Benincasa hispida]